MHGRNGSKRPESREAVMMSKPLWASMSSTTSGFKRQRRAQTEEWSFSAPKESKEDTTCPTLLGARTLLGAPGIATRSKKLLAYCYY